MRGVVHGASRATRISLLAAWVAGLAFASNAVNTMAEEAVHRYATKVSFKQGIPLRFPDFTLTYIGERLVSSKQYPRGFLNHDFVASTSSARITVSWSAGTGDIGPAVFS